jgi:hypothetical protein
MSAGLRTMVASIALPAVVGAANADEWKPTNLSYLWDSAMSNTTGIVNVTPARPVRFGDVPDDQKLGLVGTYDWPASATGRGQKAILPEPRLHRLRRWRSPPRRK